MDELANTVVDTCESTNDLCRALGEAGLPHGTWISARAQTRGRGRVGREWKSLDGNLFLSILARLDERALWSWVPLAAAVGVARALRVRWPALEPRIKWPNDVVRVRPEGAFNKLGGILCEATGNREGAFIVIGLGLNCAVAPEGIEPPATSLREETGDPRANADLVREEVIEAVLAALDTLEIEGAETLAKEYAAFSAHPPGAAVDWRANDAEAWRSGFALGLGPAGELRVKTTTGEELSLYADDVRIRYQGS